MAVLPLLPLLLLIVYVGRISMFSLGSFREKGCAMIWKYHPTLTVVEDMMDEELQRGSRVMEISQRLGLCGNIYMLSQMQEQSL